MKVREFLNLCENWHEVRIWDNEERWYGGYECSASYHDMRNIPDYYLDCYVIRWEVIYMDDRDDCCLGIVL